MVYEVQNKKLTIKNVAVHAGEAFNKGFFLEAITLLHVELEFFMRQTILLNANIDGSKKSNEKWDLTHELSYKDLAKILFVLDFISQEIYRDLQAFNKVRNKIVHGLLDLSYKKKKSINRKYITQNFKLGNELVNKICKICTDKLGINVP